MDRAYYWHWVRWGRHVRRIRELSSIALGERRTDCEQMPTQTYLVDAFTVYAASVSAAMTVFRSLFGALLPLVGNSMYDALGLGWGTSLLGFIAVAFIPMPLVFWRYGQRIRESKLFKVTF